MNNTITTPRIYVACLASYNAGILHGCWIDLDDGADTIFDHVTAMLERSTIENAEEGPFMITTGSDRIDFLNMRALKMYARLPLLS